jgi:hypothetical protein
MSNTNDERPAVSCAAMFGVCQTCNLWEPEKGYRPDMANMGYCPLFDKRTRFDHGKQCTGHSDLHSPNEKGQR